MFIAEELAERGWTLRELMLRVQSRYKSVREWQLSMLAMEMYMACAPTSPTCRLGALAGDLAFAFDVDVTLFRNLEAKWIAANGNGGDEASR